LSFFRKGLAKKKKKKRKEKKLLAKFTSQQNVLLTSYPKWLQGIANFALLILLGVCV
jgi:hypothetical protein